MIGKVVTIDGPAGSGKSSVAHQLASRLGWTFLDTGAMYRGLTAWALDRDINPARQPDEVVKLAAGIRMTFDWQSDPPELLIDDHPMGQRLRAMDTSASVSDVATLAGVRRVMVDQQRKIAQERSGLVTEGRDQGSVVFPDALVKFFLDAPATVRAARRTRELAAAGTKVDESAILAQIERRDERDRNRSDGPLICPDHAVVVDTGPMTLTEVVDHLELVVRQRLAKVEDAGCSAMGARP